MEQPADLIEPHLSNRLLHGVMRYLDTRWGRDTVDRLLVEAGLDRDYASRTTGWVSVRFQQAFNSAVEREGLRRDPRFHAASFWRNAGHSAWSAEAMGPLHAVIRSLGSPRAVLRALPRLTRQGNRTLQLVLARDRPGSARFNLAPAEGFGRVDDAVVASLQGMLEGLPSVWGLPPARVQPHRDGVGVHLDVRYADVEARVPVGTVAACLGAGVLIGVAGGWPLGVAGGCALLAGGLLWRRAREASRLLDELRSMNEVFEAADDRATSLWRERQELRRALMASRKLSGYLAHDLVEQIIDNPELEVSLGGRSTQAAVLFVDIVGFTSRCEGLSPLEVIEQLNIYFGYADAAFIDNGGVIDKRMGDGIMGVFVAGADETPQAACGRAVACGLDILERLPACNLELASMGAPPVQVRVGVAWGPLVQGNIGSDVKLEYTVLGDTVNLAARLEGAAEPGSVLVNAAGLRPESLPPCRLGDSRQVQVKGKAVPIDVVSVWPARPRSPTTGPTPGLLRSGRR